LTRSFSNFAAGDLSQTRILAYPWYTENGTFLPISYSIHGHNVGGLKMRGWKMQEWKKQEQIVDVEKATWDANPRLY